METAPHKFEEMPGNKRGRPCNRCLEIRNHPNHDPQAIHEYLREESRAAERKVKDAVTQENDLHGLAAMQARAPAAKSKCAVMYEAFSASPTKQNRLRWQAATSALKALEAAIREEKRYPTTYAKDRAAAKDCRGALVLPV